MNQLDQSRHIADGDMRQDLVRMWRSVCKRPCFGLLRMGGQQRGDILLGAGHDAIDEIHQICMRLALDRALRKGQTRQLDADAPRVGSHHQNTICHTHRFIDVMRHH